MKKLLLLAVGYYAVGIYVLMYADAAKMNDVQKFLAFTTAMSGVFLMFGWYIWIPAVLFIWAVLRLSSRRRPTTEQIRDSFMERGQTHGLKRKAKMWRETFVAGATNTGNVTATVGNKLVLNWHGTPTQRDGVLQMFPVIRDRLMPSVELGTCADAIIASIHDGGMSPNNNSNIQSLAMLWRVFTTRLDDGTYGDLIAHTNMHATFELHEQPNDQFKITWKISVMRGRTP